MPKKVVNIGILTPYIEGFYFGGLIKSIHNVAKSYGARVFIIQTSIQKRPHEDANFSSLISANHIDGWIAIAQSVKKEYLENMIARNKPVVMIAKDLDVRGGHYVLTDNYSCVKAATEHLIHHGHARIGFVGCLDISDVRERYQGYLDGLASHNIPFDPCLTFRVADAIKIGGHTAAEKLLEQGVPCTALIAGTDLNAIGVIETLTQAGIRVPEDMAIIGFDDIEDAKSTCPPLTSIQQDIFKQGFIAADTLLQKIQGNAELPQTIHVESEIIFRESCGCKQLPEIIELNIRKMRQTLETKTQVIDHLSESIYKIYGIGYDLSKSSLNKIKSLFWLNNTFFRFGCIGLWDKRCDSLDIDYVYQNDKSTLLENKISTKLEDFPPLEIFSDWTSSSEDLVFIELIRTQKQDWGALALVGPFDEIRLQFNCDTLSSIYLLLAFSLEREALSENKYRSLLDNVGQGFLSFSTDLFIDREYSLQCKRIFKQDITNLTLSSLIYPDDAEEAKFLNDLFIELLLEKNPKKQKLYHSLLPNELNLNGLTYQAEYLTSNTEDQSEQGKLIVVLTDISEKRALEYKIEHEHNVLKMVVKAVVYYNEFMHNVKDYEHFINILLPETLESTRHLSEKLEEILMQVHTFKGTFAQMDMVNIVYQLHKLEEQLSRFSKNVNLLTIEKLTQFILEQNMAGWFEEDFTILKKAIGKDFFSQGSHLIISEDQIKGLENQVSTFLPTEQSRWILAELRKLRNKPLKEMLRMYPDYLTSIATKLKKSIHSLRILGDDLLVDPDLFHDFIKSLIHVLRNAVDHGIESPDERLQKGKDEFGQIDCTVWQINHQIHISISDDGRGIHTAEIRKKLLDKKILSREEASLASDETILAHIFDFDFSTQSHVSEISGRGIGLAAVRIQVEKLGGQYVINSATGIGTTFEFILPISYHWNFQDPSLGLLTAKILPIDQLLI